MAWEGEGWRRRDVVGRRRWPDPKIQIKCDLILCQSETLEDLHPSLQN